MAKAPNKPVIPITPDHIDRAAESNAVKQLVDVSNAFWRAGVHGPFTVELPILASVHIADKGYRKCNVDAGTRVAVKDISIGVRAGLIFRFDIVGTMKNSHGTAQWIELPWDDVVNALLEFSEAVDRNLDGVNIKQIDEQVKAAIAQNKAMHKVLTEGFALAQKRSRSTATDESMSSVPGYGMF